MAFLFEIINVYDTIQNASGEKKLKVILTNEQILSR